MHQYKAMKSNIKNMAKTEFKKSTGLNQKAHNQQDMAIGK
jgi:hypothetical protein